MTERVIVPREATEEMWEAGESAVSESFSMKYGKRAAAREIYNAMLAASPNAGAVSGEELKAADRAYAVAFNEQMNQLCGTMSPPDAIASANLEGLRAALSSLGIKVGG